MATFTPQELSTICLFFGVSKETQPGNPLTELFFLEESYVNHPIGDHLEVFPHGFVVQSAEPEEDYLFSRDFAGLVQALEKLTDQVA